VNENAVIETLEKKEAQSVIAAIRRILRATESYAAQVHKATGLTVAKLTVLRTLAKMDGSSLAPLAQAIGISQATLTVLVAQLEDRALVVRTRDAQDKRKSHLNLTALGHQVLSTAPSLIQETFEQRFSALALHQRQHMIEILQQVAAMMDDEMPAAALITSEELA